MKTKGLRIRSKRYGLFSGIKPGVPPATLTIAPDEQKTTIHALVYGPDSVREETIVQPESLSTWLDDGPVTWIRVTGLGREDQLRRLGEIFGVHPLVLEDVVNRGQRPKVEEYGDDLFIVLHMAAREDHLKMEQLGIFIRGRIVITFQTGMPDCLQTVRDRIADGKGRIQRMGADYLVYAIMDSVIDHYFPLFDYYGELIEILEEEVMTAPDAGLITQVNDIKHDLLALRRILFPLREVMGKLLHEESPVLTAATHPFFRDCFDHVNQSIDLVTIYRESCTFLSEMYMSSLSNRMNEVMRVLTVMATIFIPLTFIAGIYGMNFNPEKSPWSMPELSWYWGYPAVVGVMILVAAVMILYFKTRKWF